jgi:hypothetical protein
LVFLAAALCLWLSACATNEGGGATGRADTIYLHLLAPRYYTDPPMPARRIVTATVRLAANGKDSVGHPVFDGDKVLAGRVERRGGRLFAHLKGQSLSTFNYFDGEMEMEKLAEPTFYACTGTIFLAYFVLSTNSDCGLFLGRLDRPEP